MLIHLLVIMNDGATIRRDMVATIDGWPKGKATRMFLPSL